jgi:soluble lytic murein transglycosylase-like protein
MSPSARATVVALLLGCLALPTARAGELYLEVDENGVLTITDSPRAGAEHEQVQAPTGLRPTSRPRGYTAAWDRYDRLIARTASRHGLSWALVKAVAVVESGMNPGAVSRQGALGLMQLSPRTAAALGVQDPLDPSQSLDGGARFLARQIEAFGALDMALAAFNAGPASVRLAGGVPAIPETAAFVERVLRLYAWFLDEHSLAEPGVLAPES